MGKEARLAAEIESSQEKNRKVVKVQSILKSDFFENRSNRSPLYPTVIDRIIRDEARKVAKPEAYSIYVEDLAIFRQQRIREKW